MDPPWNDSEHAMQHRSSYKVDESCMCFAHALRMFAVCPKFAALESSSTCDAEHLALVEIVWVLDCSAVFACTCVSGCITTVRDLHGPSLEMSGNFDLGGRSPCFCIYCALGRPRVSRMAKLMKTFPELMLIVKVSWPWATLRLWDFTYFM
jgi:hypothetical protein